MQSPPQGVKFAKCARGHSIQEFTDVGRSAPAEGGPERRDSNAGAPLPKPFTAEFAPHPLRYWRSQPPGRLYDRPSLMPAAFMIGHHFSISALWGERTAPAACGWSGGGRVWPSSARSAS